MKFFTSLVILLCTAFSLSGFALNMRNKLAAVNLVYLQQQTDHDALSFIWQPEFDLNHALSKDYMLKGQLLYNASVRQIFRDGEDDFLQKGRIERLWLTIGTPQTEGRVGLQSIVFGSAKILRPLQWFDNLEPTDKLKLTDGVQALLLRHYFLNNSSVWLWGINGEEKARGTQVSFTKAGTPEFGGRLEYPLGRGEIALSANHRLETVQSGLEAGYESSLGLDCKQDFGIGAWFEGCVSKQENPVDSVKIRLPLTVGTDYTFNLGNGVHALLESQLNCLSDKGFTELTSDGLSFAVSADYSFSLLDKITYTGIFTDDASGAAHTFAWSRDYQRLGWELAAFWDSGDNHGDNSSRGVKALVSYIF
jgi:hypothetical protein